jgi:hypothetical protein
VESSTRRNKVAFHLISGSLFTKSFPFVPWLFRNGPRPTLLRRPTVWANWTHDLPIHYFFSVGQVRRRALPNDIKRIRCHRLNSKRISLGPWFTFKSCVTMLQLTKTPHLVHILQTCESYSACRLQQLPREPRNNSVAFFSGGGSVPQ